MSLPRFLMGTFPYAVAGGILLEGFDPRLRTAAARRQRRRARGACMWATYRGSGLAP